LETFALIFVSLTLFNYICARFMKNDRIQQVLISRSRELFMKHGLKALTMDDIARELGMSKKTIYQVVDNKSDLIKLALRDYLDEERRNLDIIMQRADNPVEELIQIMEYFLVSVQDLDVSALNEMQKYYPEAWDIYNDYRYNFILGRMVINLQNGIQRGYYRDDLDADIMARLYVAGVEMLVHQELFPAARFTFVNIFREFLEYHLRGIVSNQGLKYLEEHNLFKAQTT
jgi:TetR/AcrR family transcriptional regulator, cholesterol catabolism regulator